MELINVGDTLLIKTRLNDQSYKITRVTKTLAMSKRESDGYEYKFKRVISGDMGHPYERWNTSVYRVIRS